MSLCPGLTYSQGLLSLQLEFSLEGVLLQYFLLIPWVPVWTHVSTPCGPSWVICIATSLSLRFITLPNSFWETWDPCWGHESLRSSVTLVYPCQLLLRKAPGWRMGSESMTVGLWPFRVSQPHCWSLLSSTFSSGASSDSSHSWRRKPCSDAWSSLNIVFQGSTSLWEGTKIQELVLCDQKRRESGNLTRKREALLSTPSVPPDWILLLPSRKRSKCITNLYSHYNKISLWCKSAFKSETCVVRIITICSKKPH